MDTFKEYSICSLCLSTTSNYLLDCDHCQLSFCYECLLEHHHTNLYNRMCTQIQDINAIVARFIGYAHSQTEWVDHLTHDRLDLQIFLRYIQETSSYATVNYLPTEVWLEHVDNLIEKDRFAIDEDCSWLLEEPKRLTSTPKKKYDIHKSIHFDFDKLLAQQAKVLTHLKVHRIGTFNRIDTQYPFLTHLTTD
ncbi:unnamed protein product, partial [Rotaria sp. Silwood1]